MKGREKKKRKEGNYMKKKEKMWSIRKIKKTKRQC